MSAVSNTFNAYATHGGSHNICLAWWCLPDALDSELYLPFRYQLVLKMVCIAFTFCSAIPVLLPIAALFMYLSYKIDRYNFLRVFKPPPRTTDRTVTCEYRQRPHLLQLYLPMNLSMRVRPILAESTALWRVRARASHGRADSVLYILPLAAFGHVLFAIFFYSKQANQPGPLVYYAGLCLLMALVMHRISAELRTQSQRPIQDEEQRHDDNDEGDGLADERGPKPSQSLAAHLDNLGELYVPPLSQSLLKAAWASKARETADRATSSTRSAAPHATHDARLPRS